MATPDDRWFEVSVHCAAVDSEAVADALREAGAAGVSIEPALLISDSADFAYEELTDRPWAVRATFPQVLPTAARRALRRHLRAAASEAPLAPLRYREVEPLDWAEEWKQFYRVQHIGRRLVVRPSWEPYETRPGEVVLELEPGAAFGTGEHETTRLCLAALERVLSPGAEVLDIGAGSGILSIAAVLLGARRVRGVDLDPLTVVVAQENAARNGVADGTEFGAGSLGDLWPWPQAPATRAAEVVLANISSVVLGTLMPLLAAALRPGGVLIASGFLVRDAHQVRAAAEAAGLRIRDEASEGDWGVLVAEAPAG